MSSVSNRHGFGFVSVRKLPEHGYFGGLLIVNGLGRPLEFHCSLPFLPTKSQTILYGPTLDEFVAGEQIARALIAKSKSKLECIFTDSSPVLAVRNVIDEPIAAVISAEDHLAESAASLVSLPEDRLHFFRLDESKLSLLADYSRDVETLQHVWAEQKPQFDLDEPFGRIAEALLEAHPSSKAA
jgi:hypothetical protein